jgi:hypothetical protein
LKEKTFWETFLGGNTLGIPPFFFKLIPMKN